MGKCNIFSKNDPISIIFLVKIRTDYKFLLHMIGDRDIFVYVFKRMSFFYTSNTLSYENDLVWNDKSIRITREWAGEWWNLTMREVFGDVDQYGSLNYGKPCCGTFALRRTAVLKKKRSFYCNHLKWLKAGSGVDEQNRLQYRTNAFPFYEYTLSIMFAMDPTNVQYDAPCMNVKKMFISRLCREDSYFDNVDKTFTNGNK